MKQLYGVLAGCMLAGCMLAGCTPSTGQNEVVAYTALDSEFSEPVYQDFTQATGVKVLPKFDVESTKTVGLVNALLAEAGRPRCDVFWNNEILNTIRLDKQGLLEAYTSPAAKNFPAEFRSDQGTWQGLAARARILLVNTKEVAEADRPTSIYDMLDEKWKGKIGIAKPLFGTTATHIACLFAHLGPEKAKEFCTKLKANGVQVMSGNAQVAQGVAAGQIAFGLTDTDDAVGMLEKGNPVAIVYPDRNADQMGTLFIPNTVSIIKGCPHPAEARKLVDYLLSSGVEEKLALGPSAQIPLNPAVKVPPRVETPATVKPLAVSFEAAADQWDRAATFVRDEFLAE
ncbi:MAG: extracellular solute-binding protein [Pirellulales bacterium]